MSYISVDIEADGPAPGLYSMISFGAVLIDKAGKLDKRFAGFLKPISDDWIPEALAVSKQTREETLAFPEPAETMQRFAEWLAAESIGRPMLLSDNNGFDAMFITYYFHRFLKRNPFGHSSTNLGSLYKGFVRDTSKNFKHLRQQRHTHDPVEDALGNAQAFLAIKKLGFKTRL